MGLIENSMNEIRRKVAPTDQEAMRIRMEQMRRMSEKFMASMIDFVERSVIEKKKIVVFPISKREDIAKLRHLIKRISNNLGFNVKSVKKRWVIVEDTKFIVETKSNLEKKSKKCKNK